MYRWIIAAVLSLACAAGAGAGQDDPRLEQLFERLLTADDPGEARVVEALIWNIWHSYDGDGDDDDIGRLMRQGGAAMNRADFDRADRLFSRVTELAPDFAEGWNRRATVRYLAGDYPGSVIDIRETLAREPRHFGALSGLGLVYIELEEPEQALAAFEAALEINPHMPGAQANVEYLRQLLAGNPI